MPTILEFDGNDVIYDIRVKESIKGKIKLPSSTVRRHKSTSGASSYARRVC